MRIVLQEAQNEVQYLSITLTELDTYMIEHVIDDFGEEICKESFLQITIANYLTESNTLHTSVMRTVVVTQSNLLNLMDNMRFNRLLFIFEK